MARLVVFDTTEVLRVWPRKLHAALAEIEETVVTVPPTVGVELAPMATPEGIAEGETEAERRARGNEQHIGKERMNQIRRQAWWARMWRDETSPYKIVRLSEEELALAERIKHMLPHRCFDNSRGQYAGDHRDAQIVCESLALEAKVLMTSNLRSINHDALNTWVVEEGARNGFRPEAVVYEADGVLMEKAHEQEGYERVLKAALISQWPIDDRTASETIVEQTRQRIDRLVQGGAALTNTGQLIVGGLGERERAVRLVEEIRGRMPLRTITTDREHPSFPKDPAEGPTPAQGSRRGSGRTRKPDTAHHRITAPSGNEPTGHKGDAKHAHPGGDHPVNGLRLQNSRPQQGKGC